jgi:hypothetical protein
MILDHPTTSRAFSLELNMFLLEEKSRSQVPCKIDATLSNLRDSWGTPMLERQIMIRKWMGNQIRKDAVLVVAENKSQ